MKKWICIVLLLFNNIALSDVIIINNSLNHQKRLYKYELQSIFLLKLSYWNNGTPITPIFLTFDDPLHLEFVTNILNITPYNFNLIVANKIETGESKHVIVVNSIQEAINTVKKITGSIAYIKSDMIFKDDYEIQIINIVD